MKWIVAIAVVFSAGQLLNAQIIYEPVQYQYGEQSKFYYGGSDPAVIARDQQVWGRSNGFAFHAGTVRHFRDVSFEPMRVYSDLLPYENAAIYGYTANDAAMAAYANVPRYFRKADLIAAAVRAADGTLVVPAQAQPLPTARPVNSTRLPQPILIIPKGQLIPPPRSNNVVIVRN